MSSTTITCPSCNHQFEVPKLLFGQIKCPICNRLIRRHAPALKKNIVGHKRKKPTHLASSFNKTLPSSPQIESENQKKEERRLEKERLKKTRKDEQDVQHQDCIGCLVILVIIFLAFVFRPASCRHSTTTYSSPSSGRYTEPTRQSEYKSTKPLWEMDGQERKELDDAWNSMSSEEQLKQIRRDFGDIVDFNE